MSAKENWDAFDRVFIEEVVADGEPSWTRGLACFSGWKLRTQWHAEELCYDRWTQLMVRWDEKVNAVIESGLPSSWDLFTRALFLPFPEKAQVLEGYNLRVG
ncbi:hypothetical protein AAVH_08574 [Aphelenchoides avenae]|nr:hypothetical protein AAVH_08574 [Aphelenchus avenae]